MLAVGAGGYTISEEMKPLENSSNISVTESALSEAEIADLLHLREEEKLAHDVYAKLYEQWGERVFTNISRSENIHTTAVAKLLATHNIPDPALAELGEFTNPELQILYHELVTQGERSLVDAVMVGATIEDLDIKDLNEALARTDRADIIAVYENLKQGSENHLRAFNKQILKQTGNNYIPQYIDLAQFEAIIATASGGSGNGWGRGQ